MRTTYSYHIHAIGSLWMPACHAAIDLNYSRDGYPFSAYSEPANWSTPEQEIDNLERAMLLHDTGDFQGIDDFEITRTIETVETVENRTIRTRETDVIRSWADEDNEWVWSDCMFGEAA